MFSLLRDAFVHNLTVTADTWTDPGKQNGDTIRVALTRSGAPGPRSHVPQNQSAVTGVVRPRATLGTSLRQRKAGGGSRKKAPRRK
jgi:hypothetical protein